MKVHEVITVGRVSFVSVFKLCYIGLAGWIIPLSIIAGIRALLGQKPVTHEDKEYFGFIGLMISLLGGLAAPPLIALFFVVFLYPGIWIYSLFSPLRIYFKAPKSEPSRPANPTPPGTSAAEQPRVPGSGGG
jgi:hypothetical protein